MAVEWICPRCNNKMYSAYERKEQEKVICIYCNCVFKNIYYIKKQK